MTPTQAPPIALVVRIEWGRVPTVLVRCPYCAEEHRHGAPDGVASGHRVAHCRGHVGPTFASTSVRS